ncbi:MAG: transglutaminase domain-containing protein [Candidatus Coatesbacteria bacterium]|nr:transglutaminase domain-containing protein [Candidatus Coatesbacteria bacterium]
MIHARRAALFTVASIIAYVLCAHSSASQPLVQKGIVALPGAGPGETITVQKGKAVASSTTISLASTSRRSVGLRDDFGVWERPRLQSGNRMFSLVDNPLGVSEVCVEAIEVAPVWLRQDLQDAFSRLGNDADVFAELLLACPDIRYLDEVAFTIAHVATRELNRLADAGDEGLLVVNAEHIYQNAEHLNYVQLVEYEDESGGGDFFTTIAYFVQDGAQRVEKELPMDYYYWYIVHPKVNAEYLKMDDQPSEQQATYGYFWREFLFEDPSEENSYRRHFFQTQPNEIPASDLAGLSAYAAGHLTSRSGDLFPVVFDENGGGVLLSEMRYDASEIIATTIRLEQAYEDGVSNLLENVVLYGDCAQLMPPGSKVLIVMDQGSTIIESILAEHGYNKRVVHSNRIGDLPLTEYYKIIVPSDQPQALYEALAANKTWITDWFNSVAPYSGKVFEFHGACQPEDSWTSLSMLGGLKCSDLNDAEIGLLAFGGYPGLKDAMSEPVVLWEGRDTGQGGRTPFKDDENALIRLGKWVNKIVPVLARDAVHRGLQANQIAVEHNGNCGENQDILCAAARACLIPVSCIDLNAEDHVWNEFYDDGWHFYETWRGGVMTTLGGKGTGVLDMDYGGRYPFSGTLRWRNDGLVEVTTDSYSETCELAATVLDKNGVPIDGALVEVWASNVLAGPYPNYMRSVWGYTDGAGTVRMKLGNTRNLLARAKTPLGNYPAGADTIQEFASYSQTGQVYSWEAPVSGTMPALDLFAVLPPPAKDGTHLSITFELPYQTLYCENPVDSNVAAEKLTPGRIDFFICDAENLAKLGRGEPVGAFAIMSDAEDGNLDFAVNTDAEYYLVFSNLDRLALNQALYYSLDVVDAEGRLADSISNLVRVPPGSYHAIKWDYQATANQRPVIVEAGFLDTTISESKGGLFTAVAYVVDPDGQRSVQSVELRYQGSPTGLLLVDDGTNGDSVPGDMLFTLQASILPGTPAGLHRVSIVAVDAAGEESVEWPFVEVKQTLDAGRDSMARQAALDATLALRADRAVRGALSAAGSRFNSVNDQPPVIMAGGFGFADISSAAGGPLTVFAHVESFGEDIERVEAFLEGGFSLGMFLHDDGLDGDAKAGDGQFTFQSSLAGGMPAGQYLIELVATTSSGEKSATYPYLMVAK